MLAFPADGVTSFRGDFDNHGTPVGLDLGNIYQGVDFEHVLKIPGVSNHPPYSLQHPTCGAQRFAKGRPLWHRLSFDNENVGGPKWVPQAERS